MLRFYSPHFASAMWGVYAALKSYAYWAFEIPSMVSFQSTFPFPLWLLWAIIAVLCFVGSVSWGRLCAVSNYARIWGLTFISFLLVVKAVSFWFGVNDTSWITGVNYFMLALCALLTATFIGRASPPVDFTDTLGILEASGGVPDDSRIGGS